MPIESALVLFSMFVPAYALVLASPGPNLLVVLRASLRGRGPAASATWGIACGVGLLALVAIVLSAWLRDGAASSMPPVEAAGRLVFAALMARMGWRSLRRAVSGPLLASPASGAGARAHFRLGLVVALSNPLTAPFFVGFFLGHPETRDPVVALLVCALVMGSRDSSGGLLNPHQQRCDHAGAARELRHA